MSNIEKKEQLYEGKAKKVYATNDPDLVIVDYKDDATAFNGEKKGTIAGKGVINNKMTNFMFKMLEKEGVPTHLVEEISDRETIVKKVSIVPLEVIIRNVAAGSFSKRMGVEEGKQLLLGKREALGQLARGFLAVQVMRDDGGHGQPLSHMVRHGRHRVKDMVEYL